MQQVAGGFFFCLPKIRIVLPKLSLHKPLCAPKPAPKPTPKCEPKRPPKCEPKRC
jgi:hypothetical protein